MKSRKETSELEIILGSTHAKDAAAFMQEYQDEMLKDRPFADYFRELIRQKGLKQQDIFLDADIPERYGYKLVSEEKRTKQRDILFRLCYAAHFNLEETQKALNIYGMPQLYVKLQRDALLMICLNDRPGGVDEVNEILQCHQMEPLRACGVQE